MTTVTLSVASLDDVTRRALAAFEGKRQGRHISFSSSELLWQVLTPNRQAIVRAMTGRGILSIRAVARLVGRDVKNVHGDVRALLDAGVLDEVEGGVEFPYDAVRVDFMLSGERAA